MSLNTESVQTEESGTDVDENISAFHKGSSVHQLLRIIKNKLQSIIYYPAYRIIDN